MLNYKELRWSNCFSYGSDNKIKFNENPITQLVGKNGHGKSSIALILEEVQFNKNSKGIKKDHILNRNVKDKSYSIALDFEKDGHEYTIEVSRGSTQKVHLYKDGEDISSHTATSTFKDIESLLGYDHKTFSQIVYQSSTASLEFLTATDTQRKKFLIDLLNLSKYSKALELFKDEASAVSKKLAVAESKVKTAQDWITKYSRETLEERTLLVVPEPPTEEERRLPELLAKLSNIGEENKRIAQNNKYKELLDAVDIPPAPKSIFSEERFNELRAEAAVAASKSSSLEKELKALRTTKTKCPTCGQALGSEEHETHLAASIAEKEFLSRDTKAEEASLQEQLTQMQKWKREHEVYQQRVSEYERYHSMWNAELPSILIDQAALESEIKATQSRIKLIKDDIAKIQAENEKIRAHNVKITLIQQQLRDMQEQLEEAQAEFSVLFKRSTNLSVLVKAFSTTGLVAYKIECLVKDLEAITNEYLAEMADGRFQLSFQISSADKLNVVITDNGSDIDINALSSGERARVNIATLLAIRSLMQSLSNTRTNLLILDETVENLDAEGKERLVEILLKEEGLNTFLISHSFTHPLIERMNIVKTNNISRIEQ